MFQAVKNRLFGGNGGNGDNDNGPGGDNGSRRMRRPRPIGGRGRMRGASGVGYEVTSTNRRHRVYALMMGLMASADRHLARTNLGRLRELCRLHDRQSSLLSGILDRAIDNVFGANFDFIPNTGDQKLNRKVKDYITLKMQSRNCDARNCQEFEDIARTALRAVWTDGDCLLVKRKDGRLLPFEADQIMTPGGGQEGVRIVLGVELDEVNRPVAYHVKQRQTRGDYGGLYKTENTERVDAQYAIMPAYRKRFNQTRGVPYLAAALQQYDRTENYIDYETLAAEGNAMLGYKIKREVTEETLPGLEDNEDSESTFDKVQKMEPFQIFELLPGEDLDMISAQRPGSQFEPYIVSCCRIIGVAVGMPLELVMLDFSKTNYSSARASLGEARRSFRRWQKFGTDKICLPWYRWQISRGIAFGELPARQELYRARCQWPAWEYIDPLKEAKGNETAIKTNTKSFSECIRDRGGEPDEVFDEIAEDMEKLKTRGIPVTVFESKGPGNAI
ncbi:MAG TPA: phage portal protein [Planctomycetes bacterium]|nr:phage portal protein [Planctomycetota bacterium]